MKTCPEKVLKATLAANQLVRVLHQAHKAAVTEHPLLMVLLRDLLILSVELERRLTEIDEILSKRKRKTRPHSVEP
jgi:hypothetical protein